MAYCKVDHKTTGNPILVDAYYWVCPSSTKCLRHFGSIIFWARKRYFLWSDTTQSIPLQAYRHCLGVINCYHLLAFTNALHNTTCSVRLYMYVMSDRQWPAKHFKLIDAKWRTYGSVNYIIIGSNNGCWIPSHHPNHCWRTVNWTPRNKTQ